MLNLLGIADAREPHRETVDLRFFPTGVAGLVYALELEREKDAVRAMALEIGPWVGKPATPNVMGYTSDKRSDTARIIHSE